MKPNPEWLERHKQVLHPLYREIGELIGWEGMLLLAERYAGEPLYLPKALLVVEAKESPAR